MYGVPFLGLISAASAFINFIARQKLLLGRGAYRSVTALLLDC